MRICSVDGCEKKHKGLGYCDKHLTQIKKYGRVMDEEYAKIKNRKCSVVGCNRKHKSHSYCDPHYNQFKRNGKIISVKIKKVVRGRVGCLVEGCDGKHEGKGYCKRHYKQIWTHGRIINIKPKIRKDNECIDCNKIISPNAKRCSLCEDINHSKLMTGKKNPEHSEWMKKNAPMKRPEVAKKSGDSRRGMKCPWVSEHLKKDNPMKRPEVVAKFMGDNNPSKRPEVRKKISDAMLGEKNHRYGKPISEKQREVLRSRCGDKHPNWQGGKSFEPYGLEFNKELKKKIRERDGYRCQECFKHQNELFIKVKGGKIKPYRLDIHHIDYNKKNNNPENLISLCRNCHMKTNFNQKKWTNYYKNKQGNC